MKLTTPLIAALIIAILIGAYYFGALDGILGANQPGEIIPKITIVLNEMETGESESNTISTGSNVLSKLTTSVDSTIFAVNPTSTYEVGFIISYSIEPPLGLPVGVGLVGYATLEGSKYDASVNTDYRMLHGTTYTNRVMTTASTPLTDYSGVASFTDANGLNFDKKWATGEDTTRIYNILGKDLGNSIWTLKCFTQTTYAGTDAYSGSTTVQITMILGGENLTVTVGNIDVNVTSP